jgi:hypothetical protein
MHTLQFLSANKTNHALPWITSMDFRRKIALLS